MPDPPPAAVGTVPPAAAPNVVYNIATTVTINNAPQVAPNNDSSEDADPEERAAMIAELKRDSKRRRKSECGFSVRELQKMSVAQRTAFSKKRGTLVGLCDNCTVNWRPLREAFLPDPDSEMTMRKADLLVKSIEDCETAFADDNTSAMREALDVVLAKRSSKCRPCGRGEQSVAQGAGVQERVGKDGRARRAQSTAACPNRGARKGDGVVGVHVG